LVLSSAKPEGIALGDRRHEYGKLEVVLLESGKDAVDGGFVV
jgi:hypothetical protein